MPTTETNQLLAAAVAAAEDKKAEDIRILALDPSESGLTDYFLICNGTNERQNVAITDEIEIRLKREFGVYPNSVEPPPGRVGPDGLRRLHCPRFFRRKARVLRPGAAAQVGEVAEHRRHQRRNQGGDHGRESYKKVRGKVFLCKKGNSKEIGTGKESNKRGRRKGRSSRKKDTFEKEEKLDLLVPRASTFIRAIRARNLLSQAEC
jgi:hypothetical protein